MGLPPIEPYEHGFADVGDGHAVYWECCGNPSGRPALFLHGGPGSGCSEGSRRFFDPSRYRIVLFDQRGCGRSRPLASDPGADLRSNTTPHLIGVIELLRAQLGIEVWTIAGLSWGSTLALAYAEVHPSRVSALVLGLVTTTTAREVDWITREMGRIFPREWDAFVAAIPSRLRHVPPVDAYAELLFDPDVSVREVAARAWCDWEDVHVSFAPGARPDPRFGDPAFRIGFARLVTHYWRHAAFLEDGQLLRDAPKLAGIPGVLIAGRYDVSSPLDVAWRLVQRWSGSELRVLEDVGHGGAGLAAAISGALSELADADAVR